MDLATIHRHGHSPGKDFLAIVIPIKGTKPSFFSPWLIRPLNIRAFFTQVVCGSVFASKYRGTWAHDFFHVGWSPHGFP